MAEEQKNPSEDDLLANAIPIDAAELDELDELEEVEESDSADQTDLAPIEIDQTTEDQSGQTSSGRTIQTFGTDARHEDKWNRTPNSPGTGAIHVKTFVAKLRLDAIDHMDQQVNEWLDAHPQYEVKFVTTTVGRLVGKNTEDALFMSVWV